MNPFYVTTPIYYVNARPHLGHAYSTIIADVLNRFHRMCGRETFFLTGTDEHGDKVVRAAKEEGKSPLAYADQISGLFKSLWPELDIEYDHFIRTTDPAHMKVVEAFLQKIYDAGDIYFSEYEGAYCFGCERFYTKRELEDGRCPDHQTVPQVIRESNYFFRMSNYQGWLVEYIATHPDFIRPERYRNEVLAFLREPLEDLCISRPKTRLQWGITLPFDDQYVTYVWFDALLNYLSAIQYPDGELFERFWPSVHHVIAKDILKPHWIYWPIMLKAAGIPMYQHLNVHGYWNVDEAKMSKSLGNVVDPLELTKLHGSDAFRYFLSREMVFGLDSSFSEAALIQRYNSDLANDVGNLFSRSLTMVHRYFDGIVPQGDAVPESQLDLDVKSAAKKTMGDYREAMEGFAFHRAMMALWQFINRINKYIDVTAPWELAKKKTQRNQLQVVLYNIVESLRVIAGLLYPVMPRTAKIMEEHLGMNSSEGFQSIEDLSVWGKIQPGTKLLKTTTLFPRVDTDKLAAQPSAGAESEKEAASYKPEVPKQTFEKIDLRVAKVLHAEPIPRSRKLLKLKVDAGEERTVVAGIAESYRPEDLIGKQVVIVANLKPAKLMGVLSSGMVLTASDKDECRLITVDGEAEPGTPLS
ncbi:MAG: methionine--tRNA ligase [Deltaproteobacteria bacterium]|nr:methionine--tRNA ligase [Deltaproteobacteria bacterium]